MTDAISRLAAALADRYTIKRELGQGGMATVYLAQDVKHNRKVAVKVLKPELSAVIGGERFVQEIQTTASLQHPHILPLFDSGTAGETDGGTPFLYYVMPYVEGETLRTKLDRETQLSVDEAVRIATDVADALDYAHRQGVIHRDIKPENILLHDGRPMVADFGIALAVSAAAGGRMTETGLSLGTPHYMSPEQATAEKDLTARSDVYSLGSVVYEMLTGDPPHTASSAQQIIMKIVTEEAAPVSRMRKSVPANVVAAVARSLEKLPADRFDSARAFADALANPAFSVAAPGVLGRPLATRSGGMIPALGVALAVTIVVAVLGWLRRPETPVTVPARFSYVPDSSHVLSAFCCGPIHAMSRDGRRFAYIGALRGQAYLFVREIGELDARVVPATHLASSPFFSPDGEWLGFVTSDGEMMKVSVETGTPVRIASLGDRITGAAWTDDDFVIYSMVGANVSIVSPEASGLMMIRADGGTPPERLTLPDSAAGELSHRIPFFVPGANTVVFTILDRSMNLNDARIALLDLGSRRITPVGPGTHAEVTGSGDLIVQAPNGAVTAQAFDSRSGRVSGPLRHLADSVFVSGSGGWSDFAVSWTGTLLYRMGTYDPSVHVLQPNGAMQRIAIDLANVGHLDAPRISPNGRLLAFSASLAGRHRVHVYDLARGTTLPITLSGDTEHTAWTEDGDSLVMAADNDRVAVVAADRSGAERVVLAAGDSVAALRPGDEVGRVTAVGAWVAFGRTRGGSDDIVMVRRDGTGAREYVATTYDEFNPALSPNGRWLAYVANETGRNEVYVGAFPDPGGRHTVSLDGGDEPVWAADGRTLYYRDASGDLIAVAVESMNGFTIGERRAIATHGAYESSDVGTDYDVSPGREEFVALPSRSGAAKLVIVVNALSGN